MTLKTLAQRSAAQPPFPALCPITSAIKQLANSIETDERGAVFTRREVVDFILDIIGYTADVPLHKMRLLEPSFGEGDFLFAVIERLLKAWKISSDSVSELSNAIVGIELHKSTFERTKEKIIELLSSELTFAEAEELACKWLMQADFLLSDELENFDFVVGNPPYVRQELIPDALIAEYRRRYHTIYDRADLYIPFIEKSLDLLKKNGALGFICSDRWMKNKYGGPLRKFVSEHFHLKYYVDMVDTPAFLTDVIAYPAITVIARGTSKTTRIAHRPKIDKSELTRLANDLKESERKSISASAQVRELEGIISGDEPWILESSDQLALVRRLEATFPLIEDAGCKVGIGVATGADKAFIAPFDELDVEEDRKLPLVMTRDILTGEIKWRGLGVVNPFAESGSLVDLKEYPRLKRYLENHKDEISKRHVAKKNSSNWYRTIDRIYPELVTKPKLLIPDIKGGAHIVYDAGTLYPHHNLYHITSDTWDLRALQPVLQSGIARLFVSIYSTKMRGGYLRFQAQYLRRIRIPSWCKISDKIKKELIEAAEAHNVSACNRVVFKLYGLNRAEREAIGGNGE